MKLYINANSYTGKQIQEAEVIRKSLRDLGHVLCSKPEEAELIVSLGGDGALLKAAEIALAEDKPLAGINSGRLGYLCLLQQKEIGDFDRILQDSIPSKRAILECEVQGSICYALNDMVISKPNFGETVDLHLSVGNKSLDFRGDGLIIATPTGSTAYNLSAGGPELDYDANVFAITPICSNGTIRPMVTCDDKEIEVRVNHGVTHLYADGKRVCETDGLIRVKRSQKTLTLLMSGEQRSGIDHI